MTEEKVRENRLRRMAKRQGFEVKKSPRRDPRAVDYGGYMLVEENKAILGSAPFPYSASLDEVEEYLTK